ncbi:MAG: hypothetical protein EO766_16355 [Hydrotalea sp. AMD]|uniref:hypothetical protein n=1 Tax=Hydrotalea sp. AMD TaxID=2501297 RepID=UPI0010281A65|nr:hypothetical protein [Hydrotalea sp. AMD]RWZ85638.1 MAG: hypothetical protein EO766_16355 [Hydrotalea sp. AMD]
MSNEAILALKELIETTGKRSKMSVVRELMPYVENAMRKGITLADIHETVNNKGGIDIKYSTFIGCYKRIKKEQKTGTDVSTPKKVETITMAQTNTNTNTSTIGGFTYSANLKKEDLV